MNPKPPSFLTLLACLFGVLHIVLPAQGQNIRRDLSQPLVRTAFVNELQTRYAQANQAAMAFATQQNLPVRGRAGNSLYILHSLSDGRPLYMATHNVNAGISSAANLVRNQSPYLVDGAGVTVGVWDGDAIRATHQEFGGRVTIRDGSPVTDFHASHVGGTIAAAGVNGAALGMAPGALLDSYSFDNDATEMAAAGAAMPGEAGKLYLSNHSYGLIHGWVTADFSGTVGPHWFGVDGDREDRNFGLYSFNARAYDEVAHNAPYYLIIKSAGNDRTDTAPGNGTTYFFFDGGAWQSKAYNSTVDPFSDNWDGGGYDTMSTGSSAKNILTVGAVNDAVSGGLRNVASGTMSSFSGWGPTDDGRVKPDLVGNGVNLFSATHASDAAYGNSSGTSMSSPNVTGSAALLVDLYEQEFPGQAMRSSTLKGLLLHTADNLGPRGPDYRYGFGLINTKAAADLILDDKAEPSAQHLSEGLLSAANTQDVYTVRWDGASPLQATLVWTDPPGVANTNLDDATPSLVHDLDVRVIRLSDGDVRMPWVLFPNSPTSWAQPGDNIVDNAEQATIETPSNGLYQVTVTYKGSLTEPDQAYSLLISGQAADDLALVPVDAFVASGEVGGPFPPFCSSYQVVNQGLSNLTWQLGGQAAWLDVFPSSGNLAPGTTQTVFACVNAVADGLAAGVYSSPIRFTNLLSGVVQEVGSELTVLTTNCISRSITQSASTDIVFPTSVACRDEADNFSTTNQYSRIFDISAMGITRPYEIESVSFGLEDGVGNEAFTLNLYLHTGAAYPSGTNTLLSSVSTNFNGLAFQPYPISAIVLPGDELVVEVVVPGLSTVFFGANDLGQTGLSYIAADDCGIFSPLSTADVGFTNTHWVMVVNGCEATPSYDLTVSSPYGSPIPDVGTLGIASGSVFRCVMPDSPVVITNLARHTCTGWSGTGDVPASGSALSTLDINLQGPSGITWLWDTEYWLETSVGGNGTGTVDVASGWYAESNLVTITATPDPGSTFHNWSGDLSGATFASNQVMLVMDQARSIEALFVGILTNQPPVLQAITNQGLAEGGFLMVDLNATDPDGQTMTYSFTNLPSFATFVGISNGVGRLDVAPGFTDSGSYSIDVVVTDNGFPALSTSTNFLLTVTELNDPPVLAVISNQVVQENALLEIPLNATDPDDDLLSFSFTNLPSFVTFTNLTNGVGRLDAAPSFTNAGLTTIGVIVTDAGVPALSVTNSFLLIVEDLNRAPVVAVISNQVMQEGATLELPVTATDPDGDFLSMSATNLPVFATMTHLSNGVGRLDFAPSFTNAGPYLIGVIATDDGVPAISVTNFFILTVEDINGAPVLDVITNRVMQEGALLSVDVNASDPDSDPLSLSATNLPSFASFTNLANGVARIDYAPSFTNAGVYTSAVFVTDGEHIASNSFVLTVEDVNRPPALTAITNRVVRENETLFFEVFANDPDGDPITMTVVNLPGFGFYIDISNGLGRVDYTPGFSDAGSYTSAVEVTDGAFIVSNQFVVTVEDVNQAPFINFVPDQSMTAGMALSVPLNAIDPDGDPMVFSRIDVPAFGTLVDLTNGVARIDFAPGSNDVGNYPIQVAVGDSELTTTNTFQLTVLETNRPPVLAVISDHFMLEGEFLEILLTGFDPDGDLFTVAVTNLPDFGAFADEPPTLIWDTVFEYEDGSPLTGFVWHRVHYGTASGVYDVTVEVGLASSFDLSTLPVGPVYYMAATAFDIFGNESALSAEFIWNPAAGTPALDQAPVATQTFDFMGLGRTIPDGSASGMADIQTVNSIITGISNLTVHINLVGGTAPGFTGINGDLYAYVQHESGFAVLLNRPGMDADNVLGYFDPGGIQADFREFGFNGNMHNYQLSPGPGVPVNGEPVMGTFKPDGRNIDSLSNTPAAVGAAVPTALLSSFEGLDPNGDWTLYVEDLLGDGSNFSLESWSLEITGGLAEPPSNDIGRIVFTPGFTDAGVYTTTVVAADGEFVVSNSFILTVGDVNRAPVLDVITNQFVLEGTTLEVPVTAVDPDGDLLTITATNLPAWSTFTVVSNGVARLDFTPDFDDAGVYTATVLAADGKFVISNSFVLTVGDVNRPPVLDVITNRFVMEGNALGVPVIATDPDDDLLTMTATNLPSFGVFTVSNSLGRIDFNPGFEDAGVYTAMVFATDGEFVVSNSFVLTVEDVNRPPVLDAITNRFVLEGNALEVPVTASDPDGDLLSMTATNLPSFGSFTDVTNGLGRLDFNPGFEDAGVYTNTVILTDGEFVLSNSFVLTVEDVNRPPVLDAITNRFVLEGNALEVPVTASDPDGDLLSMTATKLPSFGSFTDVTNGLGRLDFNPGFEDAGVYTNTVILTDGEFVLSNSFVLTVEDVNRPPVLDVITNRFVLEGNALEVPVTASDPDGDLLSMTATKLPSFAAFTVVSNGLGRIDITPGFEDAGMYTNTIILTDGEFVLSNSFVLTVEDVNRPPVLDAITNRFVLEGNALEVPVTARDPDGDLLSMTATNLPSFGAFTVVSNGLGRLDFNPGFEDAGMYTNTIILTDGEFVLSNSFVLTVEDVNRPPVLDAITNRFVLEGNALEVPVTASDPDGDLLSMTATNMPSFGAFTVVSSGLARFDFNPGFEDAGMYTNTVILMDGEFVISNSFVLTVGDVNRTPLLDVITNRFVLEGNALEVPVSATDPDGDLLSMTATKLPSFAAFTVVSNSLGRIDFNPGFEDAGVYTNTVILTDGDFVVSNSFVLTVEDVNRPPILDVITNRFVLEGNALEVPVSASDPDGDLLSMTATKLPSFGTFTVVSNGVARLDFSPGFEDVGVYTNIVILTDGEFVVSNSFVLTVGDVNRPPVLDVITNRFVLEGNALEVPVSASDPDGDLLSMTATKLPSFAAFTVVSNGLGRIDFNPGFEDAGVYTNTVILTDGDFVVSNSFVLTVGDVNRPPVLDVITNRFVLEGNALEVPVTARDPDGDLLSMTATNLPSFGTFTVVSNGVARMDFTPGFDNAGVYTNTIILTDGEFVVSNSFVLTVGDVNRPPILDVITNRFVLEGNALEVPVTARDPDGDLLSMTATNLPSFGTLTVVSNGVARLDFNPGFEDAGVYTNTIILTDGEFVVSNSFVLTVGDVNRPPVLDVITNRFVLEGGLLEVPVTARDPDGDLLSMTATKLPSFGTFTVVSNGVARLDFSPGFEDVGVYTNIVILTDGEFVVSNSFVLTVEDVNRPPVLDVITNRFVLEGNALEVPVSASDPDGDLLSMTATNLPGFGAFTGVSNGLGRIDFNPGFEDAGVYTNTIILTDGEFVVSNSFVLTVEDVNRPPVLDVITNRFVLEGNALEVPVSASDPDGDLLSMTATKLPSFGAFTGVSNGLGRIDFNPGFEDAGVYTNTVILTDGEFVVSNSFVLTVGDVNRPPILDVITNRFVLEGNALEVPVSASDPDGDLLSMTATKLPSFGTFTVVSNGVARIDFNPGFEDAGVYTNTVILTDGDFVVSNSFVLTVEDVNRPPVLDVITNRFVLEGNALEVPVSASDPDGDLLSMTATNLPGFGAFTVVTNGLGRIDFTPSFEEAGVYTNTIILTDGEFVLSNSFVLTVSEVNRPPVLDVITNRFVLEGNALEVPVTGRDPDGDLLTMTATNLPGFGSFTIISNGLGRIDFNPGFEDAGVYTNTIILTDGEFVLSNSFVLTVEDVNRPPVLDVITNRFVLEGNALEVPVTASDPDGDLLTMTATNLPGFGSFTIISNGLGRIDFTPSFEDAGVYTNTIILTDGEFVLSNSFVLTVSEVNRPPVLDVITNRFVLEGNALEVPVTATDPDGDLLSMTATNLPSFGSFTDVTNGLGRLDFNPGFEDAGVYTNTIILTDGEFVLSNSFVLTVEDVNRPPVLDVITNRFVLEGNALEVPVTASDPDGDLLTMTATNLPGFGSFTIISNGLGRIDFTPSFEDAGVYTNTIILTDGEFVLSNSFVLTVSEVNRPPVLDVITNRFVLEGNALEVPVTATDPDGDLLSMTATNLPSFGSFTDVTNGLGRLDFNPGFEDAGVYTNTIILTDGEFVLSNSFVLTVEDVNRPPVLDVITNRFVLEGNALGVPVTASDPDGDLLTMTATNLPSFGSFTIISNGLGRIDFTPSFEEAGVYTNTIILTDGEFVLSNSFVLTVSEVNRPPVLDVITNRFVLEGNALEVPVTASDPDGDLLSMTATNLPGFGAFTVVTNGLGRIDFTPSFEDAGVYTNTIILTDGEFVVSNSFVLTVGDVNRPPVLDVITNRFVWEGNALEVPVTATDPDGDLLSMTATNLPSFGSFTDVTNGLGRLDFNPGFEDAGVYTNTIILTDGEFVLSNSFVLTVEDVNRPPVLDVITNRFVLEGNALEVPVTASDPDGDLLSMTATNLPGFGAFTVVSNGLGRIDFNPGFEDAGVYTNTIILTDGEFVLSNSFVLTVGNVNRVPTLSLIPNIRLEEGGMTNITLVASDPDGDTLSYSFTNLQGFIGMTPVGNGTAQLHIQPGYFDAGTYLIEVRISDSESPSLEDAQTFRIDVTDVDIRNSLQVFRTTDPDHRLLRFPTVPGLLYTIQWTTHLQNGTWNLLAGPVPGTGRVIQVDAPSVDLRIYYRVQISEP